MARVFTTVMNKGGCLKTSITANLSAQLSLKGYKVLVIDLDEQQNVLLTFQKKKAEKTVTDWLINDDDFDDVFVNVSTNLDIVTGPESGYLLEKNIREKRKQNPLLILKEKINEIGDRYNFIFLDTPPSLGFPTGLGLVAANEILVPFQPEMYGAAGLIKTIKQVEDLRKSLNPEARIKKVIPTKVDKRSKNHRQTIEQCEQFLSKNGLEMSKVKIWDTKDGINSLFAESRPPVLSRRHNKLKQVYFKLTMEVIEQ